jgi:hypothetical protein
MILAWRIQTKCWMRMEIKFGIQRRTVRTSRLPAVLIMVLPHASAGKTLPTNLSGRVQDVKLRDNARLRESFIPISKMGSL